MVGPTDKKILPFSAAGEYLDALRKQGKRLVQCHGTFDLVHPGHIIHLQEAKALGDILVVTVTGEKFVNKGPGRPCFNDALRARSLAALECIDYVVLIPFPAAVEAIRLVKPDVYCKGREYENVHNDVTGNIRDDVTEVRAHGGEVRYIGSEVFSSTRLLNRFFDHLPTPIRTFCDQLSAQIPLEEFRTLVESFHDLRVLVVGDTIIDQYACLKVQGLTSKNRILSGRFLREETYPGGALAVYRHAAQFSDHVRFLSLLGTEPWVDALIQQVLPTDANAIIRDENFSTVVKKRYVEPLQEGNELSKLFSVNYIDESPPQNGVRNLLMQRLREELSRCDVVLLADFGHGMMQPEMRQLIQEAAPFLVLNCQTNSNNHGFNIITRQYKRADAFSLDLQEIMLSCGMRNPDCERELAAIADQFGARYAWLTRGNVMTIGYSPDQPAVYIPPLVTDVTDTVGAGDAFFTLAGLAAARGLPLEMATFLGQLAGAQAVNIMGNESPVSKAALLKSALSLLNV